MELKHEIKFEVTDEDKLGIYAYAYHRKFMLTVILLLLAGLCGVAVTWFYGWEYGVCAILIAYAVVLLVSDGAFVLFMSRGTDKLVKQKIENQVP